MHDEEGSVLVSFPARFDGRNDTIEVHKFSPIHDSQLFAISAFSMGSTPSKLSIQLKNPLKKPGISLWSL